MSAPVYPAPAPGIFRATTSQNEWYLRCGEHTRLARESKHRHATVRMLIGSGVSKGAESDNRQKFRKGFGVTLPELVEAAVHGYEEERGESEVSDTTIEQQQGIDETASAARAYGGMVAPLIEEVLFAEEPIVALVGEKTELAGTLDVVDPVGLGDTKTGREWSQESADRSRQLGNYGLLHLARLGKFPSRLWIDNVYKTTKGWKGKRIYTHRKPQDYQNSLELIQRVKKGMEAGVFLPPPEFGAWYCSKTYCPFFGRQCRFTQGG